MMNTGTLGAALLVGFAVQMVCSATAAATKEKIAIELNIFLGIMNVLLAVRFVGCLYGLY